MSVGWLKEKGQEERAWGKGRSEVAWNAGVRERGCGVRSGGARMWSKVTGDEFGWKKKISS